MLFGPMWKLASAISGMSPTNVSEKNEKTVIVMRIRRISGSAAAILKPGEEAGEPGVGRARASVRAG